MNVEQAREIGDDFLRFCAFYSVPLYTWQSDAFGQAVRRQLGRFVHHLAAVSAPRGNGKSWGSAVVGGWRLRFGPPPQLILSVALDYEGGRICLDHGKRLLRSHPELEAGVEFLADEMRVPQTGSRWLIRSRDHLASRGLHPSVVLYDEVGWAKDDELFASLLAAQASVRDPLFLVTSTVGRRKSGPLWRIKELAEATT